MTVIVRRTVSIPTASFSRMERTVEIEVEEALAHDVVVREEAPKAKGRKAAPPPADPPASDDPPPPPDPKGVTPEEFVAMQWIKAAALVRKTEDREQLAAWAEAEAKLEKPRGSVVAALQKALG